MQPEARRCLTDVIDAAAMLNVFTAEKTFPEYAADSLLRAATERQFGIIGEAIAKLSRIDQATVSRVSEYQRIISFRNILIHQYYSVDNMVVWGLLQTRLPVLTLEVQALLAEDPMSTG